MLVMGGGGVDGDLLGVMGNKGIISREQGYLYYERKQGEKSEIFTTSTVHAKPPGTPSWVLESGLGTLA